MARSVCGMRYFKNQGPRDKKEILLFAVAFELARGSTYVFITIAIPRELVAGATVAEANAAVVARKHTFALAFLFRGESVTIAPSAVLTGRARFFHAGFRIIIPVVARVAVAPSCCRIARPLKNFEVEVDVCRIW